MSNTVLYGACAFISVWLLSCSETKIIEERLAQEETSTNNSPSSLSKKLELDREQVIEKANQLKALENEIAVEKSKLDAANNEVAQIDLLSTTTTPNAAVSKSVERLFGEAESIGNKIAGAKLDDISHEMKDLLADAELELKKINGTADERQKFEEIRRAVARAQQHQEQVKDVASAVAQKKRAIFDKIDEAMSNYNAHFGDKKGDLATLIQATDSAKKLRDISDIIEDSRFFDLAAEIRNEKVNGPTFFLLLDSTRSHLSSTTTPGIIEKAQQQQQEIDGLFAVPPTSLGQLDTLARLLDQKLETGDRAFERFTDSQGLRTAREIRNEKVEELITNKPSGPPPPLGAPLKPMAAIGSYVTKINKFTEKKIATAQAKFNDAYSDLEKVYDPLRLAAIKAEQLKAQDKTTYEATYEKMLTFLSGFSVEVIMNTIKSNNVIAKNDEIEFDKNLAKIIIDAREGDSGVEKWSSFLADKIVREIMSERKKMVNDRRAFVRTIVTQEPVIIALKTAGEQIGKSFNVGEFRTRCKNYINLGFLRLNPKCDDIADELGIEGVAAVNDQLAIFQEAGRKIYGPVGKQIDIIEDGATPEEKIVEAINAINLIITPAHAIGTVFPANFTYTVNDLVNMVENVLKKQLVSASGAPFTYDGAIAEFSDLLDPSMTGDEIKEIGKNVLAKKGKGVRFLSDALSEGTYAKLIKMFVEPPEADLVKNAKEAVLGNVGGFGVKALENANRERTEAQDDETNEQAIKAFAQFFKEPLKGQLEAIAMIPGEAPDVSMLVTALRNRVAAHDKYISLKFIAESDSADVDALDIDVFAAYADRVPSAMRGLIFGKTTGPVDVVQEFGELKNKLKASLSILQASIPDNAPKFQKDASVVAPFINAFNFLFAGFIEDLNALTLDGTDDDKVAKAAARLATEPIAPYLERFAYFKTIVGEIEDPATMVERPVITILKAVKAKLDAAPSNVNVDELKTHINRFLL